jgi:hypothetical protein
MPVHEIRRKTVLKGSKLNGNGQHKPNQSLRSFCQRLKVSIKRLDQTSRSCYRRFRLIIRRFLPFLQAVAALIAIAKSLGFL